MLLLPRPRTRARLIATALSLVLAVACSSRLKRPVETAPEVKPPPAVEMPEPQPVAPPPTEVELALDGARQAERTGDMTAAADFYARAARVAGDAGRRCDALYGLALLHLEPGTLRDLTLARADLQELLDADPAHSRAREARTLLKLIEDLDGVQAQSATLRADFDLKTTEAASLKAELERKDQELKSIKQVLLQRKP